jgi:hypothetical protein
VTAADRRDVRTKIKNDFRRLGIFLLTLIAIGITTGIAYLLFQLVRRTSIDNIASAGTRFGRELIYDFLNMDSITAVFVFPLSAASVVVMAMLIWRHFDK